MPAQQALAVNRIETRRILERISSYDESSAGKWQIKGLQISDFGNSRMKKNDWTRQGFNLQSQICNLEPRAPLVID